MATRMSQNCGNCLNIPHGKSHVSELQKLPERYQTLARANPPPKEGLLAAVKKDHETSPSRIHQNNEETGIKRDAFCRGEREREKEQWCLTATSSPPPPGIDTSQKAKTLAPEWARTSCSSSSWSSGHRSLGKGAAGKDDVRQERVEGTAGKARRRRQVAGRLPRRSPGAGARQPDADGSGGSSGLRPRAPPPLPIVLVVEPTDPDPACSRICTSVQQRNHLKIFQKARE